METIVFKVPDGTKAKLKRINRNVSELMREQAERLVEGKARAGSAHDKARHLCGIFNAGRSVSTGREYLKQYAQKSAD